MRLDHGSMHRRFWLTRLGVCLFVIVFPVAATANKIYVATLSDGTLHFTHELAGEKSQLYLTQGTPSVRPNMPRVNVPQFRISERRLQPIDAFGNSSISILITAASELYDVSPALLMAVMHAESGFNPNALSPAGAVGLMQIMPPTGRRYGVRHDLFDPTNNIDVGARYLKDLLTFFKGDMELAIAAYNAGEGAVLKHGRRIPPYAETQAYVPKVMRLYSHYRQSLKNRSN